MLVLQSGGNQKAREPAPIIPFDTGETDFMAASHFQGHHTEDERTEFLKDSVALLTRAFLTPLMKEVSCGPS